MKNLFGKKLKIFFLSSLFLGLGIFSALTPVKAASISTSTLIFYYPFTNSNTYGDYTYQQYSNTRNLTQFGSNSAYSASGKFDGAIYSDNNPGSGASSASFYTYAFEDLSFKPTTEFAFSFWYKGGMNTGEQIVYSSINSLNINLQPESSNRIRLEFKNTSDQYVDLYCNSMVDFDNTWHHVVIQGTQGGTDLTFYLDGTSICSGGSMPTIGNYHTLGYHTSFLANGTYGGSYSASWGYRGYLDDFALLNRQLTTDEITALQSQSIKTYIETEPAPTTDYLLYYGDNPFYVPVNSSFDMPLVYDICSSYDPASYDYGIFLRTATGSVLYTSDWLTACSGTFHFTGTSGMKESLNMGAYFEVVGSGNSTTAASSSPFYFIEYNTVLTGTYIVKNGQGMVFTDTAADAGSTAVAFSYNVCKDPAWSASSKIWLRNKDVNSLTGVSATASTCSGTSTVSLPYSKNLYYYFNADLVFENASSTLSVASEPFIVGFSPLTNTMASSSKDFFGVPLREVACTDEEWAQSASSSPDFSVWTKLKCNTTLTVLTVATTIADLPRVIGQQFVNQFERMFPFNFPFKIKESWDASANVPLEPALSWLDMSDSSGNIYGTMPAKLFKTATDTPFMIFGADMIGAADSPQRVFINNFRSITPFINWIAFIFAIWSFGSKSLFSDLMGNTKETEVKKE